MGFRAVYPYASKFKYIAQTLSKVTDLVPFVATEEGLEVKTLSPDKTTMIILRIPSHAFEEYECDGEEEFIVRADELVKVARRGTRNDVLELALDREGKRLLMTFIDKKTGITRRFYAPLREGVVEKLREPKVELPVKIRMLTEDFKNMLKDAKLVSDEVELVASGEKLEVIAESAQKRYRNVMTLDKPLIMLTVASPARAVYGLDLLEAALKATQASETVLLEFGNNMPIKITFDVPGGGVLIYWVAPRMRT